SPEVLAAYNECVRIRGRGLQTVVTTTPDQQVVRFQLTFSSPSQGTPVPQIRTIDIKPNPNAAACSGSISPGTRIDANTYGLICQRNTTGRVSLTIDTTFGQITRDLGPEPNPPTKTDEMMAAFPTGTILAWSSNSAAIPTGWAICNGQNGTPDLRGRFLRGT